MRRLCREDFLLARCFETIDAYVCCGNSVGFVGTLVVYLGLLKIVGFMSRDVVKYLVC